MKTRILFLVFDSADAGWLRQWADAGHLPHFQRLLNESACYDVENRAGVFAVGTWFSIATGMQPTGHGRWSWMEFDPDTYQSIRSRPQRGPFPTLWETLDGEGKRVAVIDYPRLPLLGLRHGVQVVDWSPHDLVYEGLRTTPDELAARLAGEYGTDPCRGQCDHWPTDDPEDINDLARIMLERISAKTRYFERLWHERDWDMVCLGFAEAHCIGHQCWHIQHPDHDWHTPRPAPEAVEPILEVYRALDEAVGRLTTVAGENVTLVLLANPGMQANYNCHEGAVRALHRINTIMPHGSPSPAKNHEPSGDPGSPSWRMHQKSFSVPVGDGVFGVRVNLAGRERYGRIRPGAELEAYLRELVQELRALTRPDDGAPVFDVVWRTAKHYDCDDRHPLPDILCQWNRDRAFDGVASSVTGRIEARQDRGGRSGDHRPIGLVAYRGPGTRPRHAGSIADLAIGPSLSAALGHPMPDTDGRIIPDWVDP